MVNFLRSNIFKDIWIQPAAGDAGGALGAAYAVWHNSENAPRQSNNKDDHMKGSFRSKIEAYEIENVIKKYKAQYEIKDTINELKPCQTLLIKVTSLVGYRGEWSLAQEHCVGEVL